jgi:3-oxoacyl-[acyl-carrier protein] reductase
VSGDGDQYPRRSTPEVSGSALAGKSALITGGARGIGFAIATAFAERGAAVTLLDADKGAVDEATAAIREGGGTALAVHGDVRDRQVVEASVARAGDAHGGIDILVNNAGRHLHEWAIPCTSMEPEQWKEILDVNVTAALVLTKACLPQMKQRGGGVVLNVSSAAAWSPTNAYGVTKMALLALTVALATELGPLGIRVNAIAPGMVDSPAAVTGLPEDFKDSIVARQIIPRPGRMTDLVDAAVYLCSDAASFMTAQTLTVDGGLTRRV